MGLVSPLYTDPFFGVKEEVNCFYSSLLSDVVTTGSYEKGIDFSYTTSKYCFYNKDINRYIHKQF